MNTTLYRVALFATLSVSTVALSACLGPTYGTDKTATEQLVEDLGTMVSLPTSRSNDISYKPRPAIVRPPEGSSLPEPQQSVAASENPAWPESPEQRRARLVAEIDANSDNPNFESPLSASRTNQQVLTARQQTEAYREARRIQQGAYSDRRRYLSDPPLTYREPASTAAVGELGEAERIKERRRIAAAKTGEGKRWWQIW